jgi:hypothetical protein
MPNDRLRDAPAWATFEAGVGRTAWMAGTSPAMTVDD